jgi:hypothetical protein
MSYVVHIVDVAGCLVAASAPGSGGGTTTYAVEKPGVLLKPIQRT